MKKINSNVILSRFKKLDELLLFLKQIREKSKNEFLNESLIFLSAQRALEMCINICIDIGNHVISANKKQKIETYGDIFNELYRIGIIDHEMKEKLIKMVKFRNLLRHAYLEINNEIIYDILKNNLEDFNLFKKQILTRFKKQLFNDDKKV